jgi:hypothetical protein
MENLSSKTVKQLKEYAEENNINLQGAKTKAKILSILLDENVAQEPVKEQTVIRSETAEPKQKRVPLSSSGSNEHGVIISRKAEKSTSQSTEKIDLPVKIKQIALYSVKNLRWAGLGTLQKGYNIVNEEEAKKWTTLKAVREATPEEVATYYGKN